MQIIFSGRPRLWRRAASASLAVLLAVAVPARAVAEDQPGLVAVSPLHAFPAHSISWANSPADARSFFGDESLALSHGAASPVGVDLSGGEHLSADALASARPSDSGAYYSKGVLSAPEGSKATLSVLPARGYRLFSTGLDGGLKLSPLAAPGIYGAEIPSQGAALACKFAPSEDKATSSSAAVGSVSLSKADGAVENGTIALRVEEMSSEDEDAMQALDGATGDPRHVAARLYLGMSQVIGEGEGDKAWVTPLDAPLSPVTVTLALSDAALEGAESFSVMFFDGSRCIEVPATFDARGGKLTFEVSRLEHYAIVRTDASGTPVAAAPKAPGSATAADGGRLGSAAGADGLMGGASVAPEGSSGEDRGIARPEADGSKGALQEAIASGRGGDAASSEPSPAIAEPGASSAAQPRSGSELPYGAILAFLVTCCALACIVAVRASRRSKGKAGDRDRGEP